MNRRSGRMEIDYILPLRWDADASGPARDEMTDYLSRLSGWADVVVVDGSDGPLFAEHHAIWAQLVRHIPPTVTAPNGKVAGVLTGIRATHHPRLVIAHDDVRYDETALADVVARLDHAGIVAPQNVFRPLPWHTRWDTARSLTVWIALAWRAVGGVPYAGGRLRRAASSARRLRRTSRE